MKTGQHNFQTVRNQLVDGGLVVYALFITPTVIISIRRALDIGWQNIMYLHIAFVVIASIVAIFRRALSFRIRALIILGLLFTGGSAGVFALGLMGMGIFVLLVFSVMTTILLGVRTGIAAMTASILIIASAAWAITNGLITPNADATTYSVLSTSWLNAIAVFVLFTGLVVVGLGIFHRQLMASIDALNESTDEQEKSNQRLNSEIAERKLAEEELRVSEARYRTVVEDQTELICRSLPDSTITFVNEAYCQCFGKSPDELVGQKFMPFIHKEHKANVQENFASLRPENPVFTHEHPVLMPDGEVRWQSWTNRGIFDDTGKMIECQGTGRDVTERRQAEENLRLVQFAVDHNAVPTYWIQADGSFSYVNQAVCSELGYSSDELLSMSIRDIRLDFPQNAWAAHWKYMRETQTAVFETQHKRKDGTVFPVEVRSHYFEYEDEEYIWGFASDITQRKKAEEESQRLMTAIEHAGESIIVTDAQGTIEYVNPTFEENTGYTREEVTGKNPRILKSGKQDAAFYNELWDTLQRGETWRGQFENKRKNGSTYIERANISPVRDASGATINYISVQRDLTHERELEQQLLQAQKMDSLGTLAGGIAHDFNNILQAISGFSRVAQDHASGGDEILAQCLDEIEAGTRRAGDLVDQILTFSRKSEVDFTPTTLQPLVEEALRFLRSSMPSTIQIESRLDPECAQVLANATQIHQAVTNLCTNAMHAMEDGGGILRVSLEQCSLESSIDTLSGSLDVGEYVQLSVSDTGTGIAPDLIERLLDPFFTTKEVGKGTGLGLAVIHGIVKSMKGGLTIESEVGSGTTIRMILPVCLETRVPDHPPDSTPSTSSGLGSGHILVVDDEETITKLATLLLTSRGFTVDAFNDVDSALQSVQSNSKKYDVAILDYTMPGKTGLELAKDFESLSPEMSVILATGLIDGAKLKQLKSPNIVEVIKKPYNIDDLMVAINRTR